MLSNIVGLLQIFGVYYKDVTLGRVPYNSLLMSLRKLHSFLYDLRSSYISNKCKPLEYYRNILSSYEIRRVEPLLITNA